MIDILKNNSKNARKLALHIIKNKLTPVFDLDGVLIDARHRQNTNEDGTLNLELYRINSTAKMIAKDKALPLLETVRILNAQNVKYHVCTARVICKNVKKWLDENQINPVKLMGRANNLDKRKDSIIKGTHFLGGFSVYSRRRMVLIDDNEKNCDTANACGLQSIHVTFKGH